MIRHPLSRRRSRRFGIGAARGLTRGRGTATPTVALRSRLRAGMTSRGSGAGQRCDLTPPSIVLPWLDHGTQTVSVPHARSVRQDHGLDCPRVKLGAGFITSGNDGGGWSPVLPDAGVAEDPDRGGTVPDVGPESDRGPSGSPIPGRAFGLPGMTFCGS